MKHKTELETKNKSCEKITPSHKKLDKEVIDRNIQVAMQKVISLVGMDVILLANGSEYVNIDQMAIARYLTANKYPTPYNAEKWTNQQVKRLLNRIISSQTD